MINHFNLQMLQHFKLQEGVGNHVFSGRVLIDDNNFTSFAF